MMKNKGLIFDIQGFATHDGPGCRTLVFMKGCPLRCRWCANPEGFSSRPQIMYDARKCQMEPYNCVEACPHHAIEIKENGLIDINREKCEKCKDHRCVTECPTGALNIVGTYITIGDLMELVYRDREYWGDEGGLTLTGGDPLYQPKFTVNSLKECKKAYVNTAIETSGYFPWKYLKKTLDYLDWMFIDIKHMDPKQHNRETGVSNDLILKNIGRVAETEDAPPLILRLPVVPGFNDSSKNIHQTAKFMVETGVEEINLLPFHAMGGIKYEKLGMKYGYEDVEPPTKEDLMEFKKIFERYGIKSYVGNDTPF